MTPPRVPDVDVSAILNQVREEVRARRQPPPGDEDTSEAYDALNCQLQKCAEQLEITRVISAHWPLESRSLPQRAYNLVNKVVRRYLRWYINPIVDQQNEFNDVTARTLRLLIEAHQDLYQQLAEVKKNAEAVASNDMHTTLEGYVHAVNPLHAAADISLESPTSDIQARVEQRECAEPPAALPDITLRSLPRKLALHQSVNAHWALQGHSLPQRAIVLIHRLVRRYLRWLINPVVEQQNSFNAAVVEAIVPMLATDAELRAAVAAVRANHHMMRWGSDEAAR
jgi:hypothetical protein